MGRAFTRTGKRQSRSISTASTRRHKPIAVSGATLFPRHCPSLPCDKHHCLSNLDSSATSVMSEKVSSEVKHTIRDLRIGLNWGNLQQDKADDVALRAKSGSAADHDGLMPFGDEWRSKVWLCLPKIFDCSMASSLFPCCPTFLR